MSEKPYESKATEIDELFDSIFYSDAVEGDENNLGTEGAPDSDSTTGAEKSDTTTDVTPEPPKTDGEKTEEGKSGEDNSSNTPPESNSNEAKKSEEGQSAETDTGEAKTEKSNGMYETAVRLASDISEINNAFGLKIKTISDIENPKRFFELRELGLSATEAFRATNTTKSTESKSEATDKQHITSATASASGGNKGLGERELRTLREHFPDKSDKEIEALYHSVKKKGLI